MTNTQEWIFTFGIDHKNSGKCVRLKGSYDKARSDMFRLFGRNWAAQYSPTEWENIRKTHGRYIAQECPVEDLL